MLSPIGAIAVAWLTRTRIRFPLSKYSRWDASTVKGLRPGSAARACTPGRAIAAAVSAARRGLFALVTPTPAPADTGCGGTPLLRTIRAQLLLFLLRRWVNRH